MNVGIKEDAFKYVYGHTSPETAYIVHDYPWGYRLRTTIRYWVESKPKKGQRFCRQTRNPKTGKWCAPKYSIYHAVVILFLDEEAHIIYKCIDYNDGKNDINEFKDIHMDYLDCFQKEQLKNIFTYTKVMENVKWEVKIKEPNG